MMTADTLEQSIATPVYNGKMNLPERIRWTHPVCGEKKYPEKIIPFSGERATSSDHRIPQNIITSSWTIEEKRKSK